MKILDVVGGFLLGGGVLVVFGLVYFLEGLVRKDPGWLTLFFRKFLFFDLVSVEKTRLFLWISGIFLIFSGLLYSYLN